MKEEINVLIKEDEIVARVKELAEQINRDYEGKTPAAEVLRLVRI